MFSVTVVGYRVNYTSIELDVKYFRCKYSKIIIILN